MIKGDSHMSCATENVSIFLKMSQDIPVMSQNAFQNVTECFKLSQNVLNLHKFPKKKENKDKIEFRSYKKPMPDATTLLGYRGYI